MLNFNHILNLAGQKYQMIKIPKYETVAPELKSDQLKALAEVLVTELNKELGKLEDKIDKVENDLKYR